MKIVFFEVQEWEEEYIRKRLKKHRLYFFGNKLTEKNVNKVKDADVVVSFIYSDLSEKILTKLKNLKYIATMSTGFDHIDLDYCKKNGIKVSNVPYYGENTVAEHTFALILALSKKIDQAVERTKRDDFSLKGLIGFDLKGKTLGVIGVGHIGQHVIKIARGFEMNVLGFSRSKDLGLSRRLDFKWVSFDTLLRKSDVITIHAPLTEETKHMINMETIKKIRKGVYLINTSRGEIIDNDALIFGLKKGILAGAGLDVLEGECGIREEKELLQNNVVCDWKVLIQNHMLLKNKNVVVTPHSAFYTREALERILDISISNIFGFIRGRVKNKIV